MAMTTLSRDCQIAVPKDVADRWRGLPDQNFAFVLKEDGVILAAVPERDERVGLARGSNIEDDRDRDDRHGCAPSDPPAR